MSKLILSAILNRLDALETSVLGHPRKRLSKTELARAEGVSTRTVDRRVADGTLPPSDDVINGRHFWWSDSIEHHRPKRGKADTAAARAARNPRLRKPAQAAEAC
jgi:hypothetical protein